MPKTYVEPSPREAYLTRKWASAFFLALGLVFVGIAILDMQDTIALQQNLATAPAILHNTKIDRRRSGDSVRKSYRVYFSFLTGNDHEEISVGSVSKGKFAEIRAGKPFEVHYDKTDPSNNRLTLSNSPHGGSMLIIGIGLFALLTGGWMWQYTPKVVDEEQDLDQQSVKPATHL